MHPGITPEIFPSLPAQIPSDNLPGIPPIMYLRITPEMESGRTSENIPRTPPEFPLENSPKIILGISKKIPQRLPAGNVSWCSYKKPSGDFSRNFSGDSSEIAFRDPKKYLVIFSGISPGILSMIHGKIIQKIRLLPEISLKKFQ